MHKFKAVLIFSLGLLFLLAPLCLAQSQAGYTQIGAVDLTEEQLLQIEKLRLAFQEELLPLHSQLRTGYMELDLMEARGENPPKIEAKLAALTELENEIDKRFLAHDQQIRELLTDEQKVLFDRWGGLGLGPGAGWGLGLGYGPGWGRGRGYGRGAGWNRGYTRGYARPSRWAPGYGRGVRWDRGFDRGVSRSPYYSRGVRWDRGFARGMRRAGGWYCPYAIGTAGRALYRNRRIWQDE